MQGKNVGTEEVKRGSRNRKRKRRGGRNEWVVKWMDRVMKGEEIVSPNFCSFFLFGSSITLSDHLLFRFATYWRALFKL